MRIMNVLALLWMSFLSALVGCQNPVDNNSPLSRDDLLPLGENPRLLSIERTRPVKLQLRSKAPNALLEADLEEICNLVGRVPGLREYVVTFIRESLTVKDGIDVYVEPVYIKMKKNGTWNIARIDAPAL